MPAPGWYSGLRPGSTFIGEFEDDPGYAHCRVCLWPVAGDVAGGDPCSYIVLTPGGDVYEEAWEDYSSADAVADFARVGPGVARDKHIVAFRDQLSAERLSDEVRTARRVAARTRGDRPKPREPADMRGVEGRTLQLPSVGIFARIVDGATGVSPVRRRIRGKSVGGTPTAGPSAGGAPTEGRPAGTVGRPAGRAPQAGIGG